MSRWYSPIRLSNAKKAERKRLLELNEAWMIEQGLAREALAERQRAEAAAASAKREEHARIDALVREGQDLGLDRAGTAERAGLSLFTVALSERRIAGVTS